MEVTPLYTFYYLNYSVISSDFALVICGGSAHLFIVPIVVLLFFLLSSSLPFSTTIKQQEHTAKTSKKKTFFNPQHTTFFLATDHRLSIYMIPKTINKILYYIAVLGL